MDLISSGTLIVSVSYGDYIKENISQIEPFIPILIILRY